MNDVWRKLWPKDVDSLSCVDAQDLEGERHDINEMAQQAGFEEVGGDDITEMLHLHREEHMNENHMVLDEEKTREESESSSDEVQPARTLLSKVLAVISKHLDDTIAILDENYPDHQRIS